MTATAATSGLERAVRRGRELDRILVLVPHDPHLDPRIAWSIELCRAVAPTDVVGATWAVEGREPVAYDGRVLVEAAHAAEYLSRSGHVAQRIAAWTSRPRVNELLRLRAERRAGGASGRADLATRARLLVADLAAMTTTWAFVTPLMQALYRRGRASSVPPRLIVAHDLYALVPAILLKRAFGCPVLYDSHEYWPEADLLGPPWEAALVAALEGALARAADQTIAVSPQLAELLERRHRLEGVLAVPNAEPFGDGAVAPERRGDDAPVRFLLQGRMAPGRGIERLIAAWRHVDPAAILVVRAPQDPYLAVLRDEFRDLVQAGRLVFREAVAEDELVAAAREADVGLIPYGDANPNHRFACPNKLSQYLQAGLAVLVNERSEFATQLVVGERCGHGYDPDRPETLAAAVRALAADRRALDAMRDRAFILARDRFNWAVQSRPYAAALERLFHAGVGAAA